MAGFGDDNRRVVEVAQSATSKATAVGQTALMLSAGHDAHVSSDAAIHLLVNHSQPSRAPTGPRALQAL